MVQYLSDRIVSVGAVPPVRCGQPCFSHMKSISDCVSKVMYLVFSKAEVKVLYV